MKIRNKLVVFVFALFFVNVKLTIASPSEIVEPTRLIIENKHNKITNIIGNISLITGSTISVVGLVPIVHGLHLLNSPQKFKIPEVEIIVGSGIELLSSGFIISGALLKRRSKPKQMPINFNFNGNGICFTYNFDFKMHTQ